MKSVVIVMTYEKFEMQKEAIYNLRKESIQAWDGDALDEIDTLRKENTRLRKENEKLRVGAV